MTTEQGGQYACPELIKSSRRARIFFVRHGEPNIYGEDTSLTENGVTQVEQFAEYFADELKKDDSRKLVKILRSDRIRTVETARIIEKRITDGTKRREWLNVELGETRKRRHISPEGTIDPILKMGVPLEDAYEVWLRLTPEQAMMIGARWSGTVAKEAFNLASNLGDFLENYGQGPDLYYVLATHETTLGAVLLHTGFGAQKIGFAQHLEIEPKNRQMLIKSGEQMELFPMKD